MSPSRHGEYCFRCGLQCTASIQNEVPEGETEPVSYEVFSCPREHGIQAKKRLAVSVQDFNPTQPETIGGLQVPNPAVEQLAAQHQETLSQIRAADAAAPDPSTAKSYPPPLDLEYPATKLPAERSEVQ